MKKILDRRHYENRVTTQTGSVRTKWVTTAGDYTKEEVTSELGSK